MGRGGGQLTVGSAAVAAAAAGSGSAARFSRLASACAPSTVPVPGVVDAAVPAELDCGHAWPGLRRARGASRWAAGPRPRGVIFQLNLIPGLGPIQPKNSRASDSMHGRCLHSPGAGGVFGARGGARVKAGRGQKHAQLTNANTHCRRLSAGCTTGDGRLLYLACLVDRLSDRGAVAAAARVLVFALLTKHPSQRRRCPFARICDAAHGPAPRLSRLYP